MTTEIQSFTEVHASIVTKPKKPWPYYVLFFVSGFPALLYQIVWQRALCTLYGVNIESVTIIVTVFMLGLGLGSLAGGWLSNRSGVRLLLAFGLIELLVGGFGSFSLSIFHWVGQFTAGASTATVGLIAFALLLFPTMLMGSTLPLLVEHFIRFTGNVGESVGLLYSVNTFGSGFACLAAALFVMRMLGEGGSIRLAVCFNLFVGVTALLLQSQRTESTLPSQKHKPEGEGPAIPLWVGVLLAGATGFIALAYEIVWYRLYSFVTGGTAPCFADLLAYYLLGIAYGSLSVRDLCRRKLGMNVPRTLMTCSEVVVVGAVAAFLVGPALSFYVVLTPFVEQFAFVFVAASLLGSAFPLLAHATISPEQGSGRKVSLLYLSNIVGSTLGSFVIGFVVLDRYSTRTASLLLVALSVIVASILAVLAGPRGRKRIFVAGCAACIFLALISGPLYSGMYERLLARTAYRSGMHFANLVENRSGVIAVTPSGIVYGGGAYDGHFNIDPVNDTNGIFRAYAIAGLHPNPKQVLIIGLSSGSWEQIVANLPKVEDVTIVEINPGYLPLIRERSAVSSLLLNPKVHIVIDDGRRWLVSHPERRFDFILMNTTLHWRANASNLLSADFLNLMRKHLTPGGVLYYNTTKSGEAEITGVTVFPYALRISNFLAVSDSVIVFDRARLKSILMTLRIDGHAVFDLSNPAYRARLEQIVSMPEATSERIGEGLDTTIEERSSLLNRLKGMRPITDDNMGTEWALNEQ